MLKYPFLLLAGLSTAAFSTPLIDSWSTEGSGKLARIWPTLEAEIDEKENGTSRTLTSWNRRAYPANEFGDSGGDQLVPTYAGIQEISYSADSVYIRSSGMPTNIMGPWYDNILEAFDEDTDAPNPDATLFAGFPGNASILHRFPRNVSYPVTYTSLNTETQVGTSGLFVNGVPMFSSGDTFSYSNAAGEDGGPGSSAQGQGDGFWHRDAFTNEGPTFDSGNSHQAGENHHYHANPPALRYILGDSVDYDPSVVFTGLESLGGNNPYSENFNGKHSPIIGWVNDGLPLYGPYGYSDPTDATSGVRLMITGYQKRDGSNGTTDLVTTGRTTLPQWVISLGAQNSTTLTANQYGPDIDTEYVLGRYMEDYAYKGDLTGTDLYEGVAADGAYEEGTHYDLNQYNVRYCVTPEFPNGTWAYFTAISPDGTPTYPYNLAWAHFGEIVAEGVASINEAVTVVFEGGANQADSLESVTTENDEVSIVWNGVEGGSYRVETSTDLETWEENADAEFTAESDQLATVDTVTLAADVPKLFYKLVRTGLAPYEDVFGVTISEGTTSYDFTFGNNGTADPPPNGDVVQSVTVGGVTGSVTTYTLSGSIATVTVSFDTTTLIAGQSYAATLSVDGPPNSNATYVFTSTNGYAVPLEPVD